MSLREFDRDYFSKFGYDKSTNEWKQFYLVQISELRKYIGNQAKICDIGCGLGSFLEECDKVGWSTWGMDISEYAIEETKKTKAKLAVYDIQDGIPFDETFDAMTCFDVVEHLEKPEKALFNMHYKLSIGRIFLLTTPNLRSRIWKRISGWQEDETHISLKKPEEWVELLEMTGFKIIVKKTIFPILQHKEGTKGIVGKVLAKLGFGSTLYILALKQETGGDL
jgi:2-polyprenyl-3-methyl-5-hydroxy-6-metoxy-1,4-benzoquinol methylase